MAFEDTLKQSRIGGIKKEDDPLARLRNWNGSQEDQPQEPQREDPLAKLRSWGNRGQEQTYQPKPYYQPTMEAAKEYSEATKYWQGRTAQEQLFQQSGKSVDDWYDQKLDELLKLNKDKELTSNVEYNKQAEDLDALEKQIKEAERNLKYAEDMKASKRISDEHEAMKSSGLGSEAWYEQLVKEQQEAAEKNWQAQKTKENSYNKAYGGGAAAGEFAYMFQPSAEDEDAYGLASTEADEAFRAFQEAKERVQIAQLFRYEDAKQSKDYKSYVQKGDESDRNKVKLADREKENILNGGYNSDVNVLMRDDYDPYFDIAPDALLAYTYMNNDERDFYSYLLGARGEDAADAYLDEIRETLNARQGQQAAERIEAQGPGLGRVTNEMFLAGSSGLEGAILNFGQNFSNKPLKTSSTEFARQYTRQNIEGHGRGHVIEGIGFDAVNTMANMAPSIAVGVATGGVGGAAFMGLQSKGAAYKQAIDEGYTREQAEIYSTVTGAAEAGLSYVLGGFSALGGIEQFTGKLTAQIGKAGLRAAAEIGFDIVGENVEEYLQNKLEPILRNSVFGENNEIKLWNDEDTYTLILTTLTTGMMNSGEKAINRAQVDTVGRSWMKDGLDAELIEHALQSKNAEVRGRAKELQTKLGEKTANEIGGLALAYEESGGDMGFVVEHAAKTDKQATDAIHKAAEREQERVKERERKAAQSREDGAGEQIEAASAVLEEDAKAIQAVWRKDQDPDEYARSMNAAINLMAAEGTNREALDKSNLTSYLTKEQRDIAWEIGHAKYEARQQRAAELSRRGSEQEVSEIRRGTVSWEGATIDGVQYAAVDRKTLSKAEREQADVCETFAKGAGIDLVFYDDPTTADQGTYREGGTIYLNVRSKANGETLIVSTFSHELTHFAEEYGGESYEALRGYVVQTLANNDQAKFEQLVEEKRQSRGNITYEEALSEVVADGCEMMLRDTKAPEKLARENPTLLRQICEWLDGWVKKIKAAFSGVSAQHEEAKILMEHAEELQRHWDAALAEAVQNRENERVESENARSEGENARSDTENAHTVKKTTAGEDGGRVQYSIAEIKGQKDNYGLGVILDTDLFDGIKPRNWAKVLGEFVYKNLAGKELVMYDSEGNEETVRVAKETDRVRKDGANNSHKVINKLARVNGDNIKTLATVHLSEMLLTSGNESRSSDKSHQWLDEKGWIHRTTYIQDRKGNIYSAVLNIADGRNGKTIYSISNIKRVDGGAVPSTHKGRGSHTSLDSGKKISQSSDSVKVQKSEAGGVSDRALLREAAEREGASEELKKYARKADNLEAYQRRLERQQKKLAEGKLSAEEKAALEKRIEETEGLIARTQDALTRMELRPDMQQEIKAARARWWTENIPDAVETSRKLQRENRELRQSLQYFREQAQHTTAENRSVDKRDVRRFARALLKEHGSSADIDQLSRQLQRLGEKLVQGTGEDLNIHELNGIARGAARLVIDEVYREAKGNNAETDGGKPKYEYAFSKYERDERVGLVAQEIMDTMLSGEIREAETIADRNYRAMEQRMLAAREAQRKAELAAKRAERRADNAEMTALREAREELKAINREKIKQLRKELNEGREAQQKRINIERQRARLSRMLRENSAKNHVPEALRGVIGRFIQSLDTLGPFSEGTKSAAKFREEMQELSSALRSVKDSTELNDFYGDLDLTEGVRVMLQNNIDQVEAAIGKNEGTVTRKMSLEQLRTLEETLNVLSTAVKNVNSLLSDGEHRFAHMDELGEESILESYKIAERKKMGGELGRQLKWANLTPYYAFKRFGEAGQEIFRGLTRGWGKMARNIDQVQKYAEGTWTAAEAKSWESKEHSFKLVPRTLSPDGKSAVKSGSMDLKADAVDVTMTEAQIMSLYCLNRREQARGHLYGAGIRIGDYKIGHRKPTSQSEHYLLDPDDMATIVKTLSPRQIEVCDALTKYMNTVGSSWGNEVSMKLYGIRGFTEENYFPIRTDSTQHKARTADSDRGNLFRLANQSFTKQLAKNANNAIIVDSVFDVFSDHMADMAKYNAMVLPMLDAMRWYNYQGEKASVQQAIRRAFGGDAGRYFMDFMQDLNGASEGGRGEQVFSRMMSGVKVASVGANLRVALQQPTSIARAALLLNPKYLVAGAAIKGGRAKALQYSGLAVWKDLGYFDVNVNRGMREQIKHADTLKEKIQDKSLWLAEKGDQMTWGALWNACEMETKDKTGLSGEELMQKTAERFDEVILATQVMDSTLTRSSNMRSKSVMMKEFTAFMAEPTLTYNMLLDCWSEFDKIKRTKGTAAAVNKMKGPVLRTASVYVMSAALTAVAQALGDAGRDDDDYETWIQKFWQHWTEDFTDNLNPMKLIPIVQDLWNMIVEKRDKNLLVLQPVQQGMQVWNIWKERYQLATGQIDRATKTTWYGNMTNYGAIYKTLQFMSSLTGLPMGSATREFQSGYNTLLRPLLNETWGKASGKELPKWRTYDAGPEKQIQSALEGGYLDEEQAKALLIEEDVAKDETEASKTVYKWGLAGTAAYKAVKEAAVKGDEKAYREALKAMTDAGYAEKDVQSEVKGAIKEQYLQPESGQELSKAYCINYLQKFAGMNKAEAEETAQKWTCYKVTGIAYEDIEEAYRSGEISAGRALELSVTYGPATAKMNQGWTEHAKPAGIDSASYYRFWLEAGEMRSDRDADGKEIKGQAKQDKVVAYINSLNISRAQKDALYLSMYAEKNLKKTPWNK